MFRHFVEVQLTDKLAWGNTTTVFVSLISKTSFTLFHHYGLFFLIVLKKLRETSSKDQMTSIWISSCQSLPLAPRKIVLIIPVQGERIPSPSLIQKQQREPAYYPAVNASSRVGGGKGQLLFSFTGMYRESFIKCYSPSCLKAGEYNFWQVTRDVCNSTLFHFRYIKHIL